MSAFQKTPIHRSLPQFVRKRILDEIQKRGYALPCHLVAVNGPIVTVAFDLADVNLPQASIPVYGSKYVREPYQVGDGGFTFPLAVDISAAAGLGAGLPSVSMLPANLSSLYWFPGASMDYAAVDPNALTLTGLSAIDMDAPVVQTSQNLSAGTGASGVFTSMAGQTITVQNGIIVNID